MSEQTRPEPGELQKLREANRELRARLATAEETLRAIHANEVDALVIGEGSGRRVYTLCGADEAYRIFVEQMGQGAATVSGDGTILYCNRQFAQILCNPLERTIGACVYDFAEPEQEGLLRGLIWKGMSEPAVERDISIRTTTGEKVAVLMCANPLPVEGLRCTCLVITDLSEHLARLSAEAAGRAKDRFLATLSHELRTPLTPVVMSLAAMILDPKLPDQFREDVAMIHRNIELETRLIDDLLDLSRISSGKLRLDIRDVCVHELVHRVLEILGSDIGRKKLSVVTVLDAKSHRINGDAARLQQVLWNLIRNAIKFTPENGKIVISSAELAADAASGLPARCRVCVSDTGIGIGPDRLSRLFEPFEQGDPTITSRFGGLGLGLTISKTIVELHGGCIHAHSDGDGCGAAFTIELPLALPAALNDALQDATSSAKSQPGGKPDRGSVRVLLVEDHPDTARVLAQLLRKTGFQVRSAATAAGALELAADGPFDVVVSDLGLPDATGLELIAALRRDHGDVKAVAISGYGADDDIRKSRDAGFAAHLIKPITMTALAQVITSIANGSDSFCAPQSS